MRGSDFTSRAHPFGTVALDGPAGGEPNGLTQSERDALAQIGAAVGDAARGAFAPTMPAPAPAPRSPWLLVGGVAVVVVVGLFVFRRK